MQYMFLIADPEGAYEGLSQAQYQAEYDRIAAWWGEQAAAGKVLEGKELQPVETATTVRRTRIGEVTVTDGPFVETKEVIGGYGIFDVDDLDEAIAVAFSWPGPTTIEIRPVVARDGG